MLAYNLKGECGCFSSRGFLHNMEKKKKKKKKKQKKMAAERQFDRMASEMEIHMKQRFVTELFYVEKVALTDWHQCLLNVCGDQKVDVNTVRWLTLCFNSSNSDSGLPPLVQIVTSKTCMLLFITGENV